MTKPVDLGISLRPTSTPPSGVEDGAPERRSLHAWHLLLVDPRELIRSCLEYWLKSVSRMFEVTGTTAVEAVFDGGTLDLIDLAVVSCGAGPGASPWLESQIIALRARWPTLPIALIGEGAALGEAVAQKFGLQGYVPVSTNLKVALAALHLIAAGGSYVPGTTGQSLPPGAANASPARRPDPIEEDQLTPREQAVLELLERGLANKVIGFELSMSQSTVKVHVHNIIKKLRARNRTEAAVIARSRRKPAAEMGESGSADTRATPPDTAPPRPAGRRTRPLGIRV